MSRFRNTATEVVVSVDDSKDDRYADGWKPADKPATARETTTKKALSSKNDN